MADLCKKMNMFGKAIGNTARYRIVEALLKGRKTVNELVGIVKLSQPAVSQHLKTLKAANLVVDERRGQEVFYAVNTEHMFGLLKNFAAKSNSPQQKNDKKKQIKK
jgi:ArsR family transcriptional regulator, arsenate/arsenite/antimonite-responsive transcriptional repressor